MALSGWSNVKLLSRASMFAAAPITMACWFNPSAVVSAIALLMTNSNAGGTNVFHLLLSAAGTVQAFSGDPSPANGTATATGAVTSGAWNHCCAVWASSTDRRAFRAGANKGTNATSVTPGAMTTFRFGTDATGAAPAIGAIAHAAVWNIALSDAEVARLGKGISPLLVRRDGLIGYWPIWGQGGDEPSGFKAGPLTLTGALTRAAPPPLLMPRRKLLLAG